MCDMVPPPELPGCPSENAPVACRTNQRREPWSTSRGGAHAWRGIGESDAASAARDRARACEHTAGRGLATAAESDSTAAGAVNRPSSDVSHKTGA